MNDQRDQITMILNINEKKTKDNLISEIKKIINV